MDTIKLLDHQLRNLPRPYLTDAEMAVFLEGTPDSRYSKIKRMAAQGKLLHIRRGLYCLTEIVGHPAKVHAYELAQQIYGPSYISLESALSFHQLIPEMTLTVTSTVVKRSKHFMTPFGQFSYLHLPDKNFYIEVELIKENGYVFLMAKPWKAICDYVFCYKKNWQSMDPLQKSLRIDAERLPALNQNEIQLLDEYYHHRRISRFLNGICSHK